MSTKKVSAKSITSREIDTTSHHFCIEIPAAAAGEVVITENFVARDPDLPPAEGDGIKPRVIMPKERWNYISAAARIEFNERAKKSGIGKVTWKTGPNTVPRTFGKEIVLLAWAIEGAPEDRIADAIQNWLGLSPEERWWLYTQANAATGHAVKGRGKGWRKAIQIALTENPVSGQCSDDGHKNVATRPMASRSTTELKKTLTIG